MIIDIYCPLCDVNEAIELDQYRDKYLHSIHVEPSKEHRPYLNSFTISHSNHTLVFDVDQNGKVTSKRMLQKIGIYAEKIVAAIVNTLLNFLERGKEHKSLIIICDAPQLKEIILAIGSSVMLNIPMGYSAFFAVRKQEVIFEIGNINIYVGIFQDKIYNFSSDQDLVAYHINSENYQNMIDQMQKEIDKQSFDDYGVLFDDSLMNEKIWDQYLNSKIQAYPNIVMYDVSNRHKATISLFYLFERIFSVKN